MQKPNRTLLSPIGCYGFIIQENGSDLFFHKNDIISSEKDIFQGQCVSFEIENGEKGLKAINVQVFNKNKLQEEQIREVLNNIANRKLDAKHDEMTRYFYHVNKKDQLEMVIRLL